MIPDETVARVREQADAVHVIGEYVKLKRSGTSWRGPCPFHHGKDPNFAVHPRTNTYRCFVCGETGDVFEFVRKHLGLDFVEAVKLVAAKVGIEVVEVSARREGDDPRERLWEVVGAAASFFSEVLWDDANAAVARDYLASRQISRALAERFSLGFAPRGDAMQRRLEALGFDADRQLEAGLLMRREESDELRPRFRGRLMFPIWDVAGHPVGFGGRALDDGEPKYLNSAESSIFEKGKTLYGLHVAKQAIRKEGRALLVEGYVDAIRLVGAGIESVVAPLGTALTEEQAKLIVRYSRQVFLLYDSDRAGLKATFRAGDELLRQGASVRVVTLPPGEDPDTFVRSAGAAGLEPLLDAAVDVFERKIQILERAGWFADLHRRRGAIDRLLPTIRAVADPITRDLYASQTAKAVGVDRELIIREANAPAGRRAPRVAPTVADEEITLPPPVGPERRGRRNERRAGDRRAWASSRAPIEVHDQRGLRAERDLVRAMLHSRDLVELVAERYGPESFRSRSARAIFEVLLKEPEADVEALAAQLDPRVLPLLEKLMGEREAVGDPHRSCDHGLARLRVRELEERNGALDRALSIASPAEQDQIIVEKTRNMEEIKALGGVGYRTFGKSGSGPGDFTR